MFVGAVSGPQTEKKTLAYAIIFYVAHSLNIVEIILFIIVLCSTKNKDNYNCIIIGICIGFDILVIPLLAVIISLEEMELRGFLRSPTDAEAQREKRIERHVEKDSIALGCMCLPYIVLLISLAFICCISTVKSMGDESSRIPELPPEQLEAYRREQEQLDAEERRRRMEEYKQQQRDNEERLDRQLREEREQREREEREEKERRQEEERQRDIEREIMREKGYGW